jgi:hydrogenase maturation protease
MRRVLIAGYGNPLRGDDGLGGYAAERLREMDLPGAVILSPHQLTPELAEDLSRADLAIFIDARDGGAPGEWRAEDVAPEPARPGAFTHHATPAGLAASAQLLYGHAPETVLFSMSAGSFEYGEGLSPAVEAALPALLDAVAGRVRAATGTGSRCP